LNVVPGSLIALPWINTGKPGLLVAGATFTACMYQADDELSGAVATFDVK
jgi:hypothetical protein